MIRRIVLLAPLLSGCGAARPVSVVEAVGDLDCDGVTITYEMRGTSEHGQPTVTLNTPPPNTD